MYKVVLRSLTVLLTGLPPNLYREQELHSGIQMKEQLLVYFVEQQQNSLQEENSTVGFHLQPPVYTRTSTLSVTHPQATMTYFAYRCFRVV